MNDKTLKYLSTLLVIFLFGCSKSIEKSPNIVFILTDDLAYADLSSYGSEFIETPNLDKMADYGVKMTSYYAAQAVCSASRAAILTGCYPNRLGISGAFGPKSKRGINPDEFLSYEKAALGKGFLMVSATPLTRSSYHAGEDFKKLQQARNKLFSGEL